MNLINENLTSSQMDPDKLDADIKKPKWSYTREFLLSLRGLDGCKKLPSGFDESFLCELEDGMQDRPRPPGSLQFHGFRRNEYGSSPPTRGDSGNYSRSNYGKLGSCSSGPSDLDSDSQSDRDSDSGRRYSQQSRRSWQSTAQDGLLGNGSFPRPYGYAAGFSAPNMRTNDNYQLRKSNEPYHPTRTYKALTYSRKDTDTFNDETFVSTEFSNEDRTEEERRRRASFEQIRKEQQKALQEEQKLNLEHHKSGDGPGLSEVLKDKRNQMRPFLPGDELQVSTPGPTLSIALEKSSVASSSPACRPLVPPGFNNNIPGKISGLIAPVHNASLEERELSPREDVLNAETNHCQSGITAGLEPFTENKSAMKNRSPYTSSNLDPQGIVVDPETSTTGTLNDKSIVSTNRGASSSIFEKLFGGISSSVGGSDLSEHRDSKPDGTWSSNSVHSSKFARWFSEEEAKSADGLSSGMPTDLLSLIVHGDKGRCQVSDPGTTDGHPHDIFLNNLEQASELAINQSFAAGGVTNPADENSKEDSIPAMLTCEDLEQSILIEYSAQTTSSQLLLEAWSTDANVKPPSGYIDDNASLHLLSLLRKGGDQGTDQNPVTEISFSHNTLVPQEQDIITTVVSKLEDTGKNIQNPEKTLTLEMLFGSSFMKELQSVIAPVSVQRGFDTGSPEVDVLEPRGLPFAFTDIGISSSETNGISFQRPSNDDMLLDSNHQHQTQMGAAKNWLGFTNPEIHFSPMPHLKEIPDCRLFGGSVEFQIPEESTLSVADPRSNRMPAYISDLCSYDDVKFASDAPIDLMDKLAAKDEGVKIGSENMHFGRDSYENAEPQLPFHDLSLQHSSPRYQSPQMAQVGPLYGSLESPLAHMTSQMKFLGPETIFNHDSPANRHFPPDMAQQPFHHQNIRNAGFDTASYNSMLYQMQMQVNNNPHMFPVISRGGPSSYYDNQATGFLQEKKQIHGFPQGADQPNIENHRPPAPAPDNYGNNPPDAFQRLVEMEMRANPKHIHPFPSGCSQGSYSREVDMGFRYRCTIVGIGLASLRRCMLAQVVECADLRSQGLPRGRGFELPVGRLCCYLD